MVRLQPVPGLQILTISKCYMADGSNEIHGIRIQHGSPESQVVGTAGNIHGPGEIQYEEIVGMIIAQLDSLALRRLRPSRVKPVVPADIQHNIEIRFFNTGGTAHRPKLERISSFIHCLVEKQFH